VGAGPALPSSIFGLTGQGRECGRGGCLGGCVLAVILMSGLLARGFRGLPLVGEGFPSAVWSDKKIF